MYIHISSGALAKGFSGMHRGNLGRSGTLNNREVAVPIILLFHFAAYSGQALGIWV